MEELTKGFTVWPNYWNSIQHLPVDQQKEICYCLIKYGITEQMEDASIYPIGVALVNAWKPGIDNSIAKHIEGGENGKKGGRPPKKDYSELGAMRQEGKSAEECAEYFGVTVDTIYKRAEWKENNPKKIGGTPAENRGVFEF